MLHHQTTYEQPYHLARRLSTVDHFTKGRLGWNIVTGYLDSAARNLGATEQPAHDDRYAVAEEYIKVMYKLFESSWRDDAVVLDRKRGIYTDPTRVRQIDHKGKHFSVPGPHICQPSPQRTPLLLQAGTSKAGKTFAAQHAEAIFVAGHSPSVIAKNIAEIREMASTQFGRDRNDVKFLALICPVIGRTEEEAKAKFEDYQQYGSIEGALALFGGWTGIDLATYGDDQELRAVESNAIRSAVEAWSKASPGIPKWTKHTVAKHITIGGLGATVVGTPVQVADEFERWVEEADVDGFNIVRILSTVVQLSTNTPLSRHMLSSQDLSLTSPSCLCLSCGGVGYSGTTMPSLVAHIVKTSTKQRANLDLCLLTQHQSTGGKLELMHQNTPFRNDDLRYALQSIKSVLVHGNYNPFPRCFASS